MTLDPADKHNPVFSKLMKHFAERLSDLRAQNDGPLDAIKTSEMRGRIAEVKGFLALAQDRPLIEDE